jgi:hypothetical protein
VAARGDPRADGVRTARTQTTLTLRTSPRRATDRDAEQDIGYRELLSFDSPHSRALYKTIFRQRGIRCKFSSLRIDATRDGATGGAACAVDGRSCIGGAPERAVDDAVTEAQIGDVAKRLSATRVPTRANASQLGAPPSYEVAVMPAYGCHTNAATTCATGT